MSPIYDLNYVARTRGGSYSPDGCSQRNFQKAHTGRARKGSSYDASGACRVSAGKSAVEKSFRGRRSAILRRPD